MRKESSNRPQISIDNSGSPPGKNIAIRIPFLEFSRTVAFYRDIIGLPLMEEEEPYTVFEFGDKKLELDEVAHLSQAEIWLEIGCDQLDRAREYLNGRGVIRPDEIEQLPDSFEGFWVTNPANIIHLVSRAER